MSLSDEERDIVVRIEIEKTISSQVHCLILSERYILNWSQCERKVRIIVHTMWTLKT